MESLFSAVGAAGVVVCRNTEHYAKNSRQGVQAAFHIVLVLLFFYMTNCDRCMSKRSEVQGAIIT